MPQLFAVLMPSLPAIPIEAAAGIWLVCILSLCALLSGAHGPMRWIGRGLLVAILIAVIVVWGNAPFAIGWFWPSAAFLCGWCVWW